MRWSAEASGSCSRPRTPMWSRRPRQPSRRPLAVRRRRRQPKQKGWLLGEMKPTVPCLPSRVGLDAGYEIGTHGIREVVHCESPSGSPTVGGPGRAVSGLARLVRWAHVPEGGARGT